MHSCTSLPFTSFSFHGLLLNGFITITMKQWAAGDGKASLASTKPTTFLAK